MDTIFLIGILGPAPAMVQAHLKSSVKTTMYDAILDVDQVESLMFVKNREKDSNGKPTIQTFYYIPISPN